MRLGLPLNGEKQDFEVATNSTAKQNLYVSFTWYVLFLLFLTRDLKRQEGYPYLGGFLLNVRTKSSHFHVGLFNPCRDLMSKEILKQRC